MKKQSTVYYAIMLIVSLYAGGTKCLWGQLAFKPEYAEYAQQIREQLQVFTDRSTYITGESILFRVDHRMVDFDSLSWSTVLYTELITPSGRSLAQGKYLLKDRLCSGHLPIPASVLTGNYYLKCYTRWMRNVGPASFSYIPLKIINPDRVEVAEESRRDGENSSWQQQAYIQGILSCGLSNTSPGMGEDCTLQLLNRFSSDYDSLQCCVTVVPSESVDMGNGQYQLDGESDSLDQFEVKYLPDLGKGPLLTGWVERPDGKPAVSANLYLSLLGEKPDVLAAITNYQGWFGFLTPVRTGPQELYINSISSQASGLQVHIDQEFDNSTLQLPQSRFSLTETEKALAGQFLLHHQFSKAYNLPSPQDTLSPLPSLPFYGNKVERLHMDDYVNLPTLEEMFINLVESVSIQRKKGKSSFRITNNNMVLGSYLPLVMVDNIVIFDQEAVLSLPTAKVERIEVVNEIYVKGGMHFGGVIAIYSRKGDMAGIDLPAGSYFFDYISFQTDLPEIAPVPDSLGRVPDSRNTIFWEDDILVAGDQTTELSFTAPMQKGDYVALIRALAPDGEVLAATASFQVQ